MLSIAALMLGIAAAAPQAAAGELFADPLFSRGFHLTTANHPAPGEEPGLLRLPGAPGGTPAWRLAQWSSAHLLATGVFAEAGGGRWVAETPGKRVVLARPAGGGVSLFLEVNGGAEYGGGFRALNEPWPHLLIEQRFGEPVRPAQFPGLRFSLEFRVDHCRPAPGVEAARLDPGLHTAQVSAYFTVNNLNPASADHNEMIWFGIPLFDARRPLPPPHYAVDRGSEFCSGKFICTLDGARFWRGTTGDGGWRGLDADLSQLLREALALSQGHGYLARTEFADLALTTFNLGWELPGPFDAAIELRNPSLRAR